MLYLQKDGSCGFVQVRFSTLDDAEAFARKEITGDTEKLASLFTGTPITGMYGGNWSLVQRENIPEAVRDDSCRGDQKLDDDFEEFWKAFFEEDSGKQ